MSYKNSNDLPTEIYYMDGGLYSKLGTVRGKMTRWIDGVIMCKSRVYNLVTKRWTRVSIDWSLVTPPQVFKLDRMDGRSVAEWIDITDEVFRGRLENKGVRL